MKDEIKKFWKGDISDDAETLTKYSRDASIFEVRPKMVLFPKDKEDVKNLIKWVGENKDYYSLPINGGTSLAITARCAGTDMSGGAIGESIILDFTRYMNKLIGGPLPIDKSNWEIAVEPGMFYRDFEKIASSKGLILPCYTASKSINAMGGMFGNNSAGERTLKHGQMEKYILESKVVFADGEEYVIRSLSRRELERKMAQQDFEGKIYREIYGLIKENGEEIKKAKPNVRKNAAGYYLWNVFDGETFDLNKLLVGSQGTLGIVTELKLKVIPENKHSRLAVIFMNDLVSLGRVVEEILTLEPESLETYDDKTMRLAVKFFPDFLRKKGFRGGLRFLASFMPEFKMMLRDGFPKLAILAEFAGDEEKMLAQKCEQLSELMAKFNLPVHVTRDESEAEKYWSIRRDSFALLRKHIRGRRTAPFIDDVIVRPEFLPKFLPELNDILDQYKNKVVYTIAGHAGDGNFHVIPLIDFHRSDIAKIILELADKVFELVLRYRGSLTAEHNDGLMRTPYLRQMYGEHVSKIFAQIKDIFDPKNIFNPGKKVQIRGSNLTEKERAGTKDYLAAHIAREHTAIYKS